MKHGGKGERKKKSPNNEPWSFPIRQKKADAADRAEEEGNASGGGGRDGRAAKRGKPI